MITEKLVDLFVDLLVWVFSLGQGWQVVVWIVELYVFLSFVYVWYLGAVRLLIAREETPKDLTPAVYILAGPWLVLGYIGDIVLGMVFGSIIFLQLPSFKREVFTKVLSYNAVEGRGYRKKLARWFCSELLDKFDFGRKHCSCWDGETQDKCNN